MNPPQHPAPGELVTDHPFTRMHGRDFCWICNGRDWDDLSFHPERHADVKADADPWPEGYWGRFSQEKPMNDVEKRDAIEQAVGDYDPEAAKRGDRFVKGLMLGIFFGFWAGVGVMVLSSVLFR